MSKGTLKERTKKEKIEDAIETGLMAVILLPPLTVMAGLELAGRGVYKTYKVLEKQHKKVVEKEMEKERERQEERERREAIKAERRKYIR